MTKDAKPKGGWKQDPAAVRADILRTATEMFAKTGLSGTRIDEIAAQTKTSKRMIYYYFGDKTGLYAQALEAAYAHVREGERQLELEGLSPNEALAKLIGFTFDHHRRNPHFIRLVMIENIHNAGYLRNSNIIRSLNEMAIARLGDLIQRGEAEGIFRKGLDPVAVHWKISALSFFNVSNQPTFSSIYGESIFSDLGQSDLRETIVEMILRYVKAP